MKRTLCLSLVLSFFAWASQADDRAAIEKVFAGLNDSPRSPTLFVPGFTGSGELARLDSPPAGEVQRATSTAAVGEITHSVTLTGSPNLPTASRGRVVISKEPWGEATWVPVPTIPVQGAILTPADPGRWTSRFKIQSVRFIAKDVALVEASDQHYLERGSTMDQRGGSPALFVVKKDHKVWRIDSVHATAQP